ncbi:hypothetical protein [Lelliottia sp. CFBP8978]|jgi:hypothetical protein|uniref:hypothetical protein n=1 Tax=Lelliottia sp. CFBP8978 TaxID=3096522 RepID=UPI002A6B073B|nr:hypothetical protein [Lelliottia sp. CFBP8978]MDY1037892.1 hypothetical protein [Lelliottia sp. CFBP8978]
MKSIFLLLVLIIISGSVYAEECSDEDFNAADATIPLQTWNDVASFFNKFKQCDEGYLAEGVSTAVSVLLARHWEDFPQLLQVEKNNPDFEKWMLKHINTTANGEDIELIIKNSSMRCPQGETLICNKIGQSAKQVIKEFDTEGAENKTL